jgi:predicted AAA+ superfamily ATPase
MPHLRNRFILPTVFKKLAFSPVITLQGARQTGKSILARELVLPELKNSHYITLDRPSLLDEAQRNPESFLAQFEDYQTLIIDEAQKAPRLFDAIKYKVDQERKPGSYILTGSTEFSKGMLIRESLTGRVSRARIFPLTLAETLEIQMQKETKNPFFLREKPACKRGDVARMLDSGGMPHLFSVRSSSQRSELIRDWVQLVCFRDAVLFPKIKVNPELCQRILVLIATLDNPTQGEIAAKTKTDPRKILTHLKILQTLFVIHKIEPHPMSTGKTRFYLLDAGIANWLGANKDRCMETWILHELLAKFAFRGENHPDLTFYRTARGSMLDFLISDGNKIAAMKVFKTETVYDRDFELLRSFKTKAGNSAKVSLFSLGHQRRSLKKDQIEMFPWEALG